jgi:uncharacterized integral membrane protein
MQIWFIVSLLFSVIVAVFAVLNSSVVSINLMFQSFETPQSIVILGSAALGAVIVLFLGVFSKVKTTLKIRELNNALKAAEKKNDLLGNSIKDYEAKESQSKAMVSQVEDQASEIKTENQAEADLKYV